MHCSMNSRSLVKRKNSFCFEVRLQDCSDAAEAILRYKSTDASLHGEYSRHLASSFHSFRFFFCEIVYLSTQGCSRCLVKQAVSLNSNYFRQFTVTSLRSLSSQRTTPSIFFRQINWVFAKTFVRCHSPM